VTNGFLDDVEVDEVRRVVRAMVEFVHARAGDIPDHIREKGTLADIDARLRQVLDDFKTHFSAS
jgi:F0F1-type ATP synthase alpha subunit